MSNRKCELVNFVNFYTLLLNCFCKKGGFAKTISTPAMSIHKVHKFTGPKMPFLRFKNGQKGQKPGRRGSYACSECVLLVLLFTYMSVSRSFVMGDYSMCEHSGVLV